MLFNNTFQSFRKNKVPGVWDVVCKINTKINTITSIYNIVSILLSNPVPWQNWMAAYLGYTPRMKTLFRGRPLLWFMTRIREEERSKQCANDWLNYYMIGLISKQRLSIKQVINKLTTWLFVPVSSTIIFAVTQPRHTDALACRILTSARHFPRGTT